MKTTEDIFLAWLRDAHAAEKQALSLLSTQVEHLVHYSELRARIDQHIAETEEQVRALDGLLESYDTDSSAIKDVTGRMMAFAQGIGGAGAVDEVVKGSIFSYAFEQMEIASYKALIAVARRLNDPRAVEVLEAILRQEEAMAQWLAENLEAVTNEYLLRNESGEEAKR
ncbi:ferritin-like domain-containing protein [Pontibaca methylaminivorans]|uniref:Ferritin-like metal-binding protein YciE n=1 Tax=Pontibaca methylaminivorans TaxID=515897 RepID=A0A1R3X8J0_9RHOB|nr:ferritin-like domain-containing protein [Pontibaca methylaminivorans]SIT86732.1 Ferritin-like metal-binding protein YciE [Pontibaca methylaminivorans]